VHLVSWAKRFLFRPEQLDLPVSRLSGGEQARLLIARLMLQPADLLILDEPTNDLDIPTLDVLEDNLLDFPGALMLVTHDRWLLDRVSTMLLALDGTGKTGGLRTMRNGSPRENVRRKNRLVPLRHDPPSHPVPNRDQLRRQNDQACPIVSKRSGGRWRIEFSKPRRPSSPVRLQ